MQEKIARLEEMKKEYNHLREGIRLLGAEIKDDVKALLTKRKRKEPT